MTESYLKRELTLLVARALRSMPVVVVTGMRQVGKTTMLQSEEELKDREYRTLEDHGDYTMASRVPEDLLEPPRAVTIDEVQLLPQLFRSIKAAVDEGRMPGRFLLSGSSNLLLASALTESLAGRALYLELMPMTRRELRQETGDQPFIVDLLDKVPEGSGPKSAPLEPSEVLTGGMPPVAVLKAERDLWFRGFEQTYLERDVRSLAQVGDLAAFRQVLRLIACRPGGLLNLSDISRESGMSVDTVRRYVGILEASFSIVRLPAWRRGHTARLVKSPKVYCVDSGLAAWLNGFRNGDSLTASREWGPILETYVLQNLRATLAAWLPDASIHHWREQGRHEVDFVIESGRRVLPIEVKWTSRWNSADLSGLRRFMALHPDCSHGLLACRAPKLTSLGDGLFAVPLGMLLA